jgi:hypothetical protein
MKTTYNTDQTIENLVTVQCGPDASAREKYIVRETLRGLARLAVAENAMNRQKDLEKTIGVVEACEHA